MPCPYFEPQWVAGEPQHSSARLPLLEEYDGVCHATEVPLAAPAALRFQYCNHGYSRGCCDRFPDAELRSGLRYTIVERTLAALHVLCVEERNYAPASWQAIRYFVEGERLDPEPTDRCLQAQLLAFCRSYLKRFAH